MILNKIIKWIKRRKLVIGAFIFWKKEYSYVSGLTKGLEFKVHIKEKNYNLFIKKMKSYFKICKNEKTDTLDKVIDEAIDFYYDYRNTFEYGYFFPWVTNTDIRTLRKYYVVARHHKKYNLCEDYCLLMIKINCLNIKARKLSIDEPFEYYYKLMLAQVKIKEMEKDFE